MSVSKANISPYGMGSFEGRIGKKGFTFNSIMKVTISLSVFFALVMILVN